MSDTYRYPSVDDLVDELLRTAAWRVEMQAEHPEDRRNVDAHDLCARLASEVPHLEGTKHLEDYRFALEAMDDDRRAEHFQAANEYRQRIGFDHFPTTIEDYITDQLTMTDKGVDFIA